MNVGIRLISKYTGRVIAVIGHVFDTRDEAKAYFKENVCERCHRMQIINLRSDNPSMEIIEHMKSCIDGQQKV